MINFFRKANSNLRHSDLGAYVNTFIFAVEGHLEKRDYNDVIRNLMTRRDWEGDTMRNQKFTHDFACESLAPLLAVAVEQNSLFDACRPKPPEYSTIRGMHSWIFETVQKYCKKYGLDYKKLLAEVSRQGPLGDDGFTAPGYHIVKRKDKPSRERWRGEKGEILGGAFFLDNPKINFKDCDDFGVRNVRL